MWDDSDSNWFEGLFDGWLLFGDDSNIGAIIAGIVVLGIIALILWLT